MNPYILIKGSVAGPAKRLIRFTIAQRPSKLQKKEKPVVNKISTISKQRK